MLTAAGFLNMGVITTMAAWDTAAAAFHQSRAHITACFSNTTFVALSAYTLHFIPI